MDSRRADGNYGKIICTSTGQPLNGLSSPRKNVNRLTDQLDMFLTMLTGLYNSNSNKSLFTICLKVND